MLSLSSSRSPFVASLPRPPWVRPVALNPYPLPSSSTRPHVAGGHLVVLMPSRTCVRDTMTESKNSIPDTTGRASGDAASREAPGEGPAAHQKFQGINVLKELFAGRARARARALCSPPPAGIVYKTRPLAGIPVRDDGFPRAVFHDDNKRDRVTPLCARLKRAYSSRRTRVRFSFRFRYVYPSMVLLFPPTGAKFIHRHSR